MIKDISGAGILHDAMSNSTNFVNDVLLYFEKNVGIRTLCVESVTLQIWISKF